MLMGLENIYLCHRKTLLNFVLSSPPRDNKWRNVIRPEQKGRGKRPKILLVHTFPEKSPKNYKEIFQTNPLFVRLEKKLRNLSDVFLTERGRNELF